MTLEREDLEEPDLKGTRCHSSKSRKQVIRNHQRVLKRQLHGQICNCKSNYDAQRDLCKKKFSSKCFLIKSKGLPWWASG